MKAMLQDLWQKNDENQSEISRLRQENEANRIKISSLKLENDEKSDKIAGMDSTPLVEALGYWLKGGVN